METSTLVEMIQMNSTSLVKDLVNINRKLASYRWFGESAEPGWWGDGDLADAGGVGEDDWGQYYTPDV